MVFRKVYNAFRSIIPYQLKDNVRKSLQKHAPAAFINLTTSIDYHLKGYSPIVIFQMGKVGSISIAQSLKTQIPNPIFKLHIILPKQIEDIQDYYKNLGKPLGFNEEYVQARWLYRHILRRKAPIKILTLVREPVGREVSGWFQTFERRIGVPYAEWDGDVEPLKKQIVKDITHRLNEQYSETITWFDRIFKPTLGIDIYDSPFPKEKGYLRIQHENIDLLIMRLEMPDSEKEAAIAEFLGRPNFKLINANVGDEKDYAATYKEVRNTIVLPQEYIDLVYNSKYMHHFYTDAETAKFRAKWERTPGVALPSD